MADIFISYTKENSEFAVKIAQLLEYFGYSVWWDKYLGSGKIFIQEINTEINSAKGVLVIWSKLSIESAWVQHEALLGFDKKRLISVKIDNSSPPVPFNGTHTISLSDWNGEFEATEAKKIVTRVRELIPESLTNYKIANIFNTNFDDGFTNKLDLKEFERRVTLRGNQVDIRFNFINRPDFIHSLRGNQQTKKELVKYGRQNNFLIMFGSASEEPNLYFDDVFFPSLVDFTYYVTPFIILIGEDNIYGVLNGNGLFHPSVHIPISREQIINFAEPRLSVDRRVANEIIFATIERSIIARKGGEPSEGRFKID